MKPTHGHTRSVRNWIAFSAPLPFIGVLTIWTDRARSSHSVLRVLLIGLNSCAGCFGMSSAFQSTRSPANLEGWFAPRILFVKVSVGDSRLVGCHRTKAGLRFWRPIAVKRYPRTTSIRTTAGVAPTSLWDLLSTPFRSPNARRAIVSSIPKLSGPETSVQASPYLTYHLPPILLSHVAWGSTRSWPVLASSPIDRARTSVSNFQLQATQNVGFAPFFNAHYHQFRRHFIIFLPASSGIILYSCHLFLEIPPTVTWYYSSSALSQPNCPCLETFHPSPTPHPDHYHQLRFLIKSLSSTRLSTTEAFTR